jgi:hypothetical protein
MVSVLRKECEARNMIALESLNELELLELLKEDDEKNFSLKERRQYKTKSSSRKKPLVKIKAKDYITKICGGNIKKARPEWVLGRNDKVKLMRVALKGLKNGIEDFAWILQK